MSTHYPSFGRTTTGFGSVFKSLTKSLKSTASQVPVTINPTVVGGGEEFQTLIQQLKTGSISSRASVALKVADCLDKYSISSVPEIWYVGRDLCLANHPNNVRQAGLTLLIKCIGQSSPAVGDRLMYFKDIVHYCQLKPGYRIDPCYNLFITALNHLTQSGVDIHDFCVYDDDRNLNTFILSSLTFLSNDFAEDSTYFENLISTLEFVNNCLKFNYDSLDESLVSSTVSLILRFCGKTLRIDVVEAILSVLSTLTISGEIPSSCYYDAIYYLSWVYALSLNENINLLIWDCMTNLITVNGSHTLSITLCEIIQNPDLRRFRNTSINHLGLLTLPISSCIGALQLVLKIQIVNATQHNDVDLFQTLVLQSIKIALSLNIAIINTSFLRSFDRLFSKENYAENFNIHLQELFSKVLPFHFWYSKFSMFEVLKFLQVNSDQDANYLQSICVGLQTLYEDHELEAPKDNLVQFFMHFHRYLSKDNIKFVFKYYTDEKLCTMLNPLWKDDSLNLLSYFYYNSDDVQTKIDCLRVIIEALTISISVSTDKNVDYDLLLEILRKSNREKDMLLVDFLIDEIFAFVAFQCPTDVYSQCCSLIIQDLKESANVVTVDKASRFSSLDSFGTSGGKTNDTLGCHFSVLFLEKIATSMARIFLLTLDNESSKAKETYEVIIALFEHSLVFKQVEILLTLSKCLIRIRATTENYIYLTQPTDMTGLAGTFKRNTEDPEFVQQDHYKWVYPEQLLFLPEKYFDKPSRRLVLYSGEENVDVIEEGKHEIDLSTWFKYVVTIMEQFIDWELYSFVWAHFCSQLSNMQLFNNSQNHVIKLKSIICDQLTINLPSSVEIPKGTTKADLQVALIRSMSALVGYRNHFSKYDEDQLIKALIFGLDWWERTAIPCINILTVCCYEMPASMQKFVPVILTKLQTRVTSTIASTHTLEFLMALIQVPVLISNFTLDDFKRVFGIAFKYIQFAHDMKSRIQEGSKSSKSDPNILQQYGVDAEVDKTPSTQLNDFTPILTQYVFTFSYRVISDWFLNMGINNRKRISSYLIKNLIGCTEVKNELDDHTIGYLDFIYRFTYSDLPLVFTTTNGRYVNDEVQTKRWIMGNIIITMETYTQNGDSTWSITRPTGVTKLDIKLHDQPKNVDEESKSIIDSNFYLLQLFENISKTNTKPIPVIDDSVTERAFSVLDRIPTMEFHKIGIIYIGPWQKDEQEVLSNQTGSLSYQKFISSIGSLYKLNQTPRQIYVGGLDTENNDDGEYTRYWQSKTVQVVFHIVTMMGGNNLNLKKRHIGNNYVNIYFDESGETFNFNIIKSQFNFLNIVITPHSFTCNDKRIGSKQSHGTFFRVKIYRRSGVPGVFSISHFKLISEDNLPGYIRNISIIADHFATIWHNVSYVSNWSRRVKQINSIITKTKASHETIRVTEKEEKSHNTTQSFLHQLQEKPVNYREDDNMNYEYLTAENDDIYQFVEFNSYTN